MHEAGEPDHRAARHATARTAREALGVDRSDARRGLGSIGEPKVGQQVALANVEEEVLATWTAPAKAPGLAARNAIRPGPARPARGAGSRTVRQLDGLDQGKAKQIAVEADRALHVRADQREVADALGRARGRNKRCARSR